jgi:hypothetical protein
MNRSRTPTGQLLSKLSENNDAPIPDAAFRVGAKFYRHFLSAGK